MSLKTYSAYPFEFFPENMEDLSDEHGERFLRIFPKLKRGTVENRVHVRWLTTTGETPPGECKRQKRRSVCLMIFFCSEETYIETLFII